METSVSFGVTECDSSWVLVSTETETKSQEPEVPFDLTSSWVSLPTAVESLSNSWTEMEGASQSCPSTYLGTVTTEKVLPFWFYADLAYIRHTIPGHKQDLMSTVFVDHKLHFFGRNSTTYTGVIIELPVTDPSKPKEVIISFKGTTCKWDLLLSSSVTPSYNSCLRIGGHAGYLSEYNKRREEILENIHKIASDCGILLSSLKVRFTGHSLGGALAQICCLDWTKNICPNSSSNESDGIPTLVTFGAPRVIDTETYNAFECDKIFALQIILPLDPIVGLPPQAIFGYCGIGTIIQLPSTGYHSLAAYKKGLKIVPYIPIFYIPQDQSV
eukprot:TRINITY_DN9885_c0_g1_i1.p1 TRINITY_DN9885_c0_g1~~TRINITY_DN9885_c0_g1_i1.p1  ORF type:complete len:329 (-),score=37.50 TRINITY_DN9885_c0_g1_i1:179-1165(-)